MQEVGDRFDGDGCRAPRIRAGGYLESEEVFIELKGRHRRGVPVRQIIPSPPAAERRIRESTVVADDFSLDAQDTLLFQECRPPLEHSEWIAPAKPRRSGRIT